MNWQAIGALALLAVGFAAGYGVRDATADAEMAELQKTEALARAAQGRKDYARLVTAMDAAASASGDLNRARADAERLRQYFDRRLRRAEALTQDADGVELARCTKLLRESTELLSEGRELALRSAVQADAIVRSLR